MAIVTITRRSPRRRSYVAPARFRGLALVALVAAVPVLGAANAALLALVITR
jgi:hypothetical protein